MTRPPLDPALTRQARPELRLANRSRDKRLTAYLLISACNEQLHSTHVPQNAIIAISITPVKTKRKRVSGVMDIRTCTYYIWVRVITAPPWASHLTIAARMASLYQSLRRSS